MVMVRRTIANRRLMIFMEVRVNEAWLLQMQK